MKIKNSITSLFVIATMLMSFATIAAVDIETDANSVTLDGYDAVAYFTQNAAVKGNPEFTSVHGGAIYQFSSASNRDTFNANPDKFAPQFGGFCAYGAALGKKFEIDGRAFEIVHGKLYVQKSMDVAETWAEDKFENIVLANEQWKSIQSIPAKDL